MLKYSQFSIHRLPFIHNLVQYDYNKKLPHTIFEESEKVDRVHVKTMGIT